MKKKFIAVKSTLGYISYITISVLIILLLFLNLNIDKFIWLFTLLFIFPLSGIIGLSYFNTSIIIDNNTKRVNLISNPYLSTTKTRLKNASLDKWNSEVFIDEIKEMNIKKLPKELINKYTGSKYFFHNYLVISLLNSSSKKYFNISMFSKKQIKQITSIISEIKNS